jgi:hypothetical protein
MARKGWSWSTTDTMGVRDHSGTFPENLKPKREIQARAETIRMYIGTACGDAEKVWKEFV